MQPDTSPVFIVGCPRSGTSALSWALASHPDFWTSAESHLMYALVHEGDILPRLDSVYDYAAAGDDFWFNKNKVSREEFFASIGAGIDALFRSRSKGKRWVEASPEHVHVVEETLRLMPEARFLHVIRDGRAVVNSMLNSGFDIDWAQNFSTACKTWVYFIEPGLGLGEKYPEHVLDLPHNELVADPRTCCGKMLEFLHAPPSEKPAEFLITKRVNSSYGNVEKKDIRKAKDPATLKQAPWQDWTRRERDTFTRIAGKSMERIGLEVAWE